MRILIFTAGALVAALGFFAFHRSGDPRLLQGGLTLGGGWIICGIFSMRAKWHGIAGAGILAFLGAIRALPSVTSLGSSPAAPFNVAAGLICTVVLVAVIRVLLAARRQQAIDDLQSGRDPRR